MTLKINYRVVLHAKALKEILALPRKQREKVKKIVDDLGENPVPRTAVRLHGSVIAYRIRIEDYRLIYEIHATEIVVYVVGVAHRKEVYQKVLRRISKGPVK